MHTLPPATRLQDSELEALARRRAAAKLGWLIHALVYLLVNLLLAALSYASGRHWSVFPLLGWGISLAVHGAVVFFISGGSGLHDKLLQRERERLTAQREPW